MILKIVASSVMLYDIQLKSQQIAAAIPSTFYWYLVTTHFTHRVPDTVIHWTYVRTVG